MRVARELGLDAGACGGEVHGGGGPDDDDDVEVLYEPGGVVHGLPELLSRPGGGDPGPSRPGGGRAIALLVHRERPPSKGGGGCRRVHPVVLIDPLTVSVSGVVCHTTHT